jgi:hypothetical protein
LKTGYSTINFIEEDWLQDHLITKLNMLYIFAGSILLPSYAINPCRQHDVNKKYAFKAEHENMKTFYFAAENQVDMERWVEALKMASLVQRAPG